jgi:pimeloyl-ACP methyl ester carboxylesterase
MKGSSRFRFVALAFAVLGLLLAAPAAEARPGFNHNAAIFVHGFVGSGAQFESQKMRFTSNGYPGSYITVLEYDSTFATETREQVHARLDQLIAELKQQTGRPQVDLLGHSLGTSVSQEYLNSSPERAANVAHYVNIDGRTADSPPGGVPTLAIWAGRGTPGREIVGAKNVTIPNQTHVQVATSSESFVEYYKFFTGRKPWTQDIARESGRLTIAGRALLFPHNRGIVGATVEVWEVSGATGQRTSAAPVARLTIGASGDWGPVAIEAGRHYEFALLRPGVSPNHYYYEPFVRSDHLVRLLDSDALEALGDKSHKHTGLVVIRYKELWGDQGSESDVLAINGTSVCNPATCPIEQQVNAVFAFDRGSDGRTDLSAPDPAYSSLPFLTGVDIFIPAAIPPTGKVSVGLTSRGVGPVRTVNFPNFASATDAVIVQLNDFEQTRP